MIDQYPTGAAIPEAQGESSGCAVCQRQCLISDGAVGYGTTRLNRRGELFTLIYGPVSAVIFDISVSTV